MPIYININGNWEELSGTDRPFANVNGEWKGISTVHANVNGDWKQVYQYDIVGPTVPTPVVTSYGSYDSISWSTITDSGSGVSSATLYQAFHNVTDNLYENTFASTPININGSSTTFAIPSARRNSPSGKHYQVYYWIAATDNAGNTTYGDQIGAVSPFINTKPLGTYFFAPAAADSRNIGNTAWLDATVEGIVGYSGSRAYGCWFYGTDVFQNACKGWNANSGTIYIKRASSTDSNRGNTGTFYLQTHNLGSKGSFGATFGGTLIEQYLSGNSASAYVNLSYDMLTRLQDGSGQGFGLVYHSNAPGFLLGMRDFSGLITLNYS